jgi:hypothetical protein
MSSIPETGINPVSQRTKREVKNVPGYQGSGSSGLNIVINEKRTIEIISGKTPNSPIVFWHYYCG